MKELIELINQVYTGYYGTKHRAELISRLQEIYVKTVDDNRIKKPENDTKKP